MTDFRKAAIEISDELLISLKAQKIFVEALRDCAPSKARKIISQDIENRILLIEDQICATRVMKKELLEEE